MWWQKDDLADKLIANNAARPRPGMDKPDFERIAMNRFAGSRKPTPTDQEQPAE